MPRKKSVDPFEAIVGYFMQASTLEELNTAFRAVRTIVAVRLVKDFPSSTPEPMARPVTRRRRIKPAPTDPSADLATTAVEAPTPAPAPKRRRRRMRVDSSLPASEATPLVPLQTEVGEASDETYTGQ